VEAADEWPVKVIIETCLLNREEKIRACQIVVESGAKFVQNLHRLQHGRRHGGRCQADARNRRPEVRVKASGGIRDTQTALAMIEAGATRLGTSAASPS